MQPIKFRARVTQNGKPFMFYQEDQYLISFLRRVTHFIAFGENAKDRVDAFNGGRHESYLPKPLEEYLDRPTGLEDITGKQIYEGDIVSTGEDNVGEVVFCVNQETGSAQWLINTVWENGEEYEECLHPPLEILGNTFENPELLPKL